MLQLRIITCSNQYHTGWLQFKEEVENWTDLWISSKSEQFFQRVIRAFPKKWEKIVVKVMENTLSHNFIPSFLQ